MALSPTTIKYIAIGVLVVLAAMFVASFLLDLLGAAIGMALALFLIWLGVRFIFGKGLPGGMQKALRKAAGEDKPEGEK